VFKSPSTGSVQLRLTAVILRTVKVNPVTIAGGVTSGQAKVVGITVTSVVFIFGVDSLSAVCKVKLYCVLQLRPVTL